MSHCDVQDPTRLLIKLDGWSIYRTIAHHLLIGVTADNDVVSWRLVRADFDAKTAEACDEDGNLCYVSLGTEDIPNVEDHRR